MQRGATFRLERHHSTGSPARRSGGEERAALRRGGRGYFRRGTRRSALQPPWRTKTHTSAWNGGWRPSTQQLGKYERGKRRSHWRLRSLPPPSAWVTGRIYGASDLDISAGLGVPSSAGELPDARRPFLPDLYCCSVTESTGNLHVRECSASRCGMKEAKQIWEFALEQMNRGIVD